MKTILALAAFAACSLAQWDTNSAPFRLILKSSNETLDGTALGACHEGAGIEGLCLTGEKESDPAASYTTFYHAESSATTPPLSGGILYWNLTYNGNLTAPSAMRFTSDYTTDLAIPIFMPSNTSFTLVYFSGEGCMYLPRSTDNTVSPPAPLNETQQLENWYICQTRYSYLYYTLAWKVGVTGEPENPSCEKVEVHRVFV